MAKAPKQNSPKRADPKGDSKKPTVEVEDAVVVEEKSPDRPVKQERKKPEAEKELDSPAAPEQNASADPAPEKTDIHESGRKDEASPKISPSVQNGVGVKAALGFISGGIIAAIIGFAAARYVVPEGWPFPGVPPAEDPLATAVDEQAREIAALRATVEKLQNDKSLQTQIVTLRDEMNADVAQLDQKIAAIAPRLDDLDRRLVDVEKLAPEGSAAAKMAAEAYARELASLREMFQGELAKIEAAQTDVNALEADAVKAAHSAEIQASLAKVQAALETGEPFGDALAALSEKASITPPPALAAVADEGVPSLAELQDAFPQAAREALNASIRAAVAAGEMSRLTAFIRTQLGSRSLEPKPGNDPDAILSRAEAALNHGDLAGALTELDALPDAAKPAIAQWRKQAETRLAALKASAALAEELNAK